MAILTSGAGGIGEGREAVRGRKPTRPDEIRKRLSKLGTLAEEFPEILALYLFGSFHKGSPNRLSDVDIAVLLHQAELARRRRTRIELRIVELLGTDEVDVVFFDQAPPRLKKEIVSNSLLLFDRDPALRRLIEASAVLEYLDIKPLFDLQRRMLLDRIRKRVGSDAR